MGRIIGLASCTHLACGSVPSGAVGVLCAGALLQGSGLHWAMETLSSNLVRLACMTLLARSGRSLQNNLSRTCSSQDPAAFTGPTRWRMSCSYRKWLWTTGFRTGKPVSIRSAFLSPHGSTLKYFHLISVSRFFSCKISLGFLWLL